MAASIVAGSLAFAELLADSAWRSPFDVERHFHIVQRGQGSGSRHVADPGQGGNPLSKPKSDKNWKCSASFAFEDGKLARVTVAPNQVVGPYDTKKDSKTGEKVPIPQSEPCSFSLPNCAVH